MLTRGCVQPGVLERSLALVVGQVGHLGLPGARHSRAGLELLVVGIMPFLDVYRSLVPLARVRQPARARGASYYLVEHRSSW